MNLSKLKKDKVLTAGKTVEQIVARDKKIKVMKPDEDSPEFLNSNIDGCDYTVGELKKMVPGVIFLKRKDRIIMIPPDISAKPIPLISVLQISDVFNDKKYRKTDGEDN